MQNPRFLLVHGTFKPNAEWTLNTSSLARAIVDNFNGATIERFIWDGKNSIRSRAAAARSLSARLAEIQATEPATPLVLIAHSHGGNVALQAIADLPTAKNVAALVTLGTPFFTFIPREVGNSTVYAMSLALGASTLFYWVANNLLAGFAESMAGIGLVSSILFLWLTFSIRERMIKSNNETKSWLEQLGSKRSIDGLPVLSIHFGLDEARLWLVALSFVRKVDRALALSARKYLNLTKERAVVAGVAVAILAFILYTPSMNPEGLLASLLLQVVSLFVSIAAICVVLLAALSPLAVVASFIATHRFGFGGQPGLTALQFDLQIDTAPSSGSPYTRKFSTVLALVRGVFASNSKFATPHALGYSDKRSIDFICSWTKDMLSFYRRPGYGPGW
jgi:hypothetical protein